MGVADAETASNANALDLEKLVGESSLVNDTYTALIYYSYSFTDPATFTIDGELEDFAGSNSTAIAASSGGVAGLTCVEPHRGVGSDAAARSKECKEAYVCAEWDDQHLQCHRFEYVRRLLAREDQSLGTNQGQVSQGFTS